MASESVAPHEEAASAQRITFARYKSLKFVAKTYCFAARGQPQNGMRPCEAPPAKFTTITFQESFERHS